MPPSPCIFRLGITGGIGSGKSTLARLLSDHGAAWLDADAAARRSTASGGSAIAAIRDTFGPELLDASGALDRARMRTLAFAHPSARTQLEAIIHPLVSAQLAQEAQAAAARGVRLVAYDIPLLVESGHWRTHLDAVAVVDCEEATQIQRTMARSQLDRATVQTIVAAQASRAARRAVADFVVYNEHPSLSALQNQAAQIAFFFGL